MSRVTTLLIVLILTGSPVADAACVSWCDARPMTATPTCRENITDSMSMAISNGSGTCVALLAASPFLREEGRIAFLAQTSPGGFHALDALLMEGARLAHARGDWKAIDRRPAPTLVLRL
jgi:hypothetical protein